MDIYFMADHFNLPKIRKNSTVGAGTLCFPFCQGTSRLCSRLNSHPETNKFFTIGW